MKAKKGYFAFFHAATRLHSLFYDKPVGRMSSKSANTERKLSRLTMKNDQQLIETSKTLKPDQKTAIEENVLSCEISSICDRSKIVSRIFYFVQATVTLLDQQ